MEFLKIQLLAKKKTSRFNVQPQKDKCFLVPLALKKTAATKNVSYY